MRGCIQEAKLSDKTLRSLKKGEHRYRLILTLGRDPLSKRWKQRWVTFTGTRKEAEAKLRELVGEVDRGEFVEPTKVTVGEWLAAWLEKVKLRINESTYVSYKNVVDNHLTPALGAIRLQRLVPMHVEQYYAASKLSQRTLAIHHSVLTSALSAAVNNGVLRTNVVAGKRVTNRPRVRAGEDVLHNVWSADEARRFITALKQEGNAQYIAIFAVALDSGVRKGELLGLKWQDVDLASGTLRVERQLIRYTDEDSVVTAPPKRGGIRTVDLSEDTVTLLKEHKREQAELKLKNRMHYEDHGLMFAHAWEQQTSRNSVLGRPLGESTVEGQLKRLCGVADVKRISMHGLRHTCATLLLSAGVAPHVVQRRLGHKNITITLGIYGHVLPSMQQDAAKRLGAMLHG